MQGESAWGVVQPIVGGGGQMSERVRAERSAFDAAIAAQKDPWE